MKQQIIEILVSLKNEIELTDLMEGIGVEEIRDLIEEKIKVVNRIPSVNLDLFESDFQYSTTWKDICDQVGANYCQNHIKMEVRNLLFGE